MKQPILTLRQHRQTSDRSYLKEVIPQFDTLASAAKALGISYTSLWRIMRQLGVQHG